MDSKQLAQRIIDAIWEQVDIDGGVLHKDHALEAVERALSDRMHSTTSTVHNGFTVGHGDGVNVYRPMAVAMSKAEEQRQWEAFLNAWKSVR